MKTFIVIGTPHFGKDTKKEIQAETQMESIEKFKRLFALSIFKRIKSVKK